MNKTEYWNCLRSRPFKSITKEEYETLLTQPLLIEIEGQPRLTLAGMAVCDYAFKVVFDYPDMSRAQQSEKMRSVFPEAINQADLDTATDYYYRSMLLPKEQLKAKKSSLKLSTIL